MAVAACVDPAVVIEPWDEPAVSGSTASNHSGVAGREALRGGIGGSVRRGDGDDQAAQAAHAAIPGDRVRGPPAARWRAEAQDPSRNAAPRAAARRRQPRLGHSGTHRGVQPPGADGRLPLDHGPSSWPARLHSKEKSLVAKERDPNALRPGAIPSSRRSQTSPLRVWFLWTKPARIRR
jgi:hypothetical protein